MLENLANNRNKRRKAQISKAGIQDFRNNSGIGGEQHREHICFPVR